MDVKSLKVLLQVINIDVSVQGSVVLAV